MPICLVLPVNLPLKWSLLNVVLLIYGTVPLTKPKSPEYIPLIEELAEKIQHTLDYCRDVSEKRSEFRIAQKKVVILPWQE